MQTKSFLRLITCAALAFGALQTQAADAKANPNGTWTWTMRGRGEGAPERTITLKLKAEGEKLTGKVAMPGREDRVNEVDIADGKIKGDEVSFTVTREQGDNKFVTKYLGKISGDTITGKTSTERNGEARERDWVAKRQAEKKS